MNKTVILLVDATYAGQRRGRSCFQAFSGTGKLDFEESDREPAVVPWGGDTYPEYLTMIERRALERIPINRAALLSFDGISGIHPCVVRDISPFGACISAPYYVFARDFELSFNGYDRIFICRVVWRRGTLCGVLFVRCPGSSKPADDSGASTNGKRLDRRIRTVWQRAASGEWAWKS